MKVEDSLYILIIYSDANEITVKVHLVTIDMIIQ